MRTLIIHAARCSHALYTIYDPLALLLHHVNKGFLQIVIKPPGRGAKKTTTSFVAIFMVVNTNHYEERPVILNCLAKNDASP